MKSRRRSIFKYPNNLHRVVFTALLVGSLLTISCARIALTPASVNDPNPAVGRPNPQPQQTIEAHTVTGNDPHFALRWVWSDIPVSTLYSGAVQLIAEEGMVVILGLLNLAGEEELIVLDGLDGETILWRITGQPRLGYPSAMAINNAVLYVGFSAGTGNVAAYELKTGQELWLSRSIGGRAISLVKVDDKYVYVLTESGRVRLAVDTGKKMLLAGQFENYTEYVQTDYIAYRIDYTPGTIYVQGVQAIDRTTGKSLWTNSDVIGSIAVSDQAVFALVEDNQLLGLDPAGGEKLFSIQFSPPAFRQQNSDGGLDAYHVAIDKQTGMLYIFLGDSRQLFAFEIVDF